NYPNPFNPTTTLSYQIPQAGNVTLKVYDVLGREVVTLVDEHQVQGRYAVKLDGRNMASGVYFYRLQVHDFVAVKKMLLLK
ncbi:MAG: T9SS type A sorting domain-containing protein, partial [Ignavibacteria bacterium]|nr:T9SS type A sorting domain-containing protein [Ignavibacteria bacterium]